MNNFGKNLALWIIIALLLVALFNLFQNSSGRGPHAQLAFSDFLGEVERGLVTDVTIQGNTIQGHFSDGRAFSTYAPGMPTWPSAMPAHCQRTGSPMNSWTIASGRSAVRNCLLREGARRGLPS